MDDLGSTLAKRFGAEGCDLFARGSTALYALFGGLPPGEVIIPGICCETVALAAIYAGMTPVIADVEIETACISTRTIAAVITPLTRAIVVVHAFGCRAEVAGLRALVGDRPIVLIEDLAHAVGDPSVGTELDYVLLSFADGKIIPGSGGALLRRNGMPAIRGALPAPASDRVLAQLASSLRNLVHALADLRREDETARIAAAFRAIAPHYRALIVRAGAPDPAPVLAAIPTLEATRASRFANYAYYRDHLASPRVVAMALQPTAMVWRCPVLADTGEHALALTAALRRAKVHASNHYFPLDALLGDRTAPGTAAIGSRIINLWVEPATTREELRRTVDLINDFR